MKKNLKKDQRKFINIITQLINAAKAEKINDNRMEYALQTNYGKLRISIHEDNDFVYSVFTKFDEVDKAREKFSCNPFTGKYNINKYSMSEVVWDFYDLLIGVGIPEVNLESVPIEELA